MNTEPQKINAVVKHRYTTSAERVFDAWLNPELVGKWMFGPALREEKILRIEIEARLGGSFSFLVLRDGEELDHVGEYIELKRPNRLVFTWGLPKYSPDFSIVRIDITPLESGCELTLTHELTPEWVDYVDRTRDAWTKMLGVLDKTLSQ